MKSLVLGLFLTSMVAFSAVTRADEDSGAYVGGLFGLSVPSANNTSARPLYGIMGGAKLGSEYGVGGYYFSSSKKEDAGAGQKFDFNYDLYGVEGSYYFEGEAKGVFLGLRLGLSKVKSVSSNVSPFHWGLVAGYNKFLGANFSLGGEVSYYSIAAADPVSGFNTLNFLAAARLWF